MPVIQVISINLFFVFPFTLISCLCVMFFFKRQFEKERKIFLISISSFTRHLQHEKNMRHDGRIFSFIRFIIAQCTGFPPSASYIIYLVDSSGNLQPTFFFVEYAYTEMSRAFVFDAMLGSVRYRTAGL